LYEAKKLFFLLAGGRRKVSEIFFRLRVNVTGRKKSFSLEIKFHSMSWHNRNVSRRKACLLAQPATREMFIILSSRRKHVYPLIHHQKHDNVIVHNIPFTL
jgi:hypothetical protein